ncbi:MAG: TIR domain-containing protein [Bacillota bacterium]|nr:TIR domain-containing protein [Bacillota bacterium]
MENKRVFISYSWDSTDHQEWVLYLANQLRKKGLIAEIDVFETQTKSTNLNKMMVEKVRDSDYIVIVLTENYARKATSFEGGVGFESQLILPFLKEYPNKLVPIIRHKGNFEAVFPFQLKGHLAIDFSDNNQFEEKLEELVYRLYEKPRYYVEPVGEIPILEPTIPTLTPTLFFKKTDVFNQSTIDQLFPGWVLRLNQSIIFSNQDVVVAGLQKGQDAWQMQGKVVVLQFDNASGNWLTKWSGCILSDNNAFPYYEFQSMVVVKSNSQKRALAVVAADCGGSSGYGQALALTIDESGACILNGKFDVNQMAVNQEGNTITVSGDQQFGTHWLSFQGEEYVDYETSSSDLSIDLAVQVNFKLDVNGDIVLLGQHVLNMSIGQTISFIPADERTREAFNQGIIGIYSDAWNNDYPLNTSNSDRLWKGNSYTFDKSGEAHFLLVTDDKVTSIPFENPIPTITINVQS